MRQAVFDDVDVLPKITPGGDLSLHQRADIVRGRLFGHEPDAAADPADVGIDGKRGEIHVESGIHSAPLPPLSSASNYP